MAGLNFGAIGTAVGGFLTGYDQARERQLKQQQQQEVLRQEQEQRQRQQRQEQATRRLYGLAQSGQLDAIQGNLPGSTPMPAASEGPGPDAGPQIDSSFGGPQQQAAQQYQQAPSGSGMRSGLPGATSFRAGEDQLTRLGVAPDVARGAVSYMDRNESGGNPQAVNPTSGATGRAQWLGPRKAALTSQYGDKPSDEQQAQFMGAELQGPERRTLDNLRSAKTGAEGYKIWGRDYERPGPTALAAAVARMPAEFHQEARQTATKAAASVPQEVYGRVSLKALADIMDKADPGGDPLVKMYAIEQAQKLLAPSELRRWELFKMEHDDQFHMALQDRTDARQERSLAAGADRQERSIIAGEQRQEQRDIAAERRQDKTLSARASAGADAKLSSDAVSTMADQYLAGDRTVMQNLGRGAQGSQNIVALRAEIAKKMAERGMSGADMATKMAEFEGLKAGERTLTQRTANIGMRIAEAKTFAPLALAASEKVDRTQFPTLNSLLLAAERGTGGEDVVRLSVATMSLLNAYAAAVTPTGTPTEGAQSRAHELLDKAWSQGQYRVAIDQLMKEMEAASKSPGTVREEFRRGADPARSTAAPAAAAPPEQPGGTGQGVEAPEQTDPNTGEVWVYRDGKWQPKKPPI